MSDQTSKGYGNLEMYRRGMALLKPVHDPVLTFPDYEKYDLASQMRRASKSIPTNIAEGYSRRRSPKELCSFLALAVGSANEMEVHLEVAHELQYISDARYSELQDAYEIVGKQLSQLIKYWRSVKPPVPSIQSPGD